MRIRISSAALVALALTTLSCGDNRALNPSVPRLTGAVFAVSPALVPAVRISELHYDNAGTDAGEAIDLGKSSKVIPIAAWPI